MQHSRRHGQRAVVLIVSIAVLTVLALLASLFATTSKMERLVSRNYVDMARAKMLATAGIDDAVIKLRGLLLSNSFNTTLTWRYWGEDFNRDSVLQPAEDVDANGVEEQNACLLRYALNPSFAVLASPPVPGQPLPPPKQINIWDDQRQQMTPRGMSGQMAATYPNGSDTYVVKVVDTASQLYINGPVVNPNGTPQQQNMLTNSWVMMLNTLGAEVGCSVQLGTAIQQMKQILLRPFATKGELKGASAPFLGDTDYKKVKDYVCINTWVDLSTIKPNPQGLTNGYFPGPQNNYQPFPWNYKYSLEPRAPVNLNAAEHPVLVAVLNGLNAHICEEFAWNYQVSGGGGTMDAERVRPPNPGPITLAQARNIADQIIAERSLRPFDTWDDFYTWIDGTNLNRGGRRLNGASTDQGAMIKANANPNTLFSKFNPNQAVWKPVDKTDLAPSGGSGGGIPGYTTEFTFGPMGVFEITSMGRVVGDTKVVATHEVITLIQVFDVARHTTQKDFVQATQLYTAGQLSWSSGLSTSTPPPILENGTMTLPESMPDQTDVNTPHHPPSDFDGQVSLAPKWIRPPGCVHAANMFSAPLSGLQIAMDDQASSFAVRDDIYADSPPPVENESVFDTNNDQKYVNIPKSMQDESDLFPDGCYQGRDRYRHLEYNELWRPLQSGTMTWWVKNNHDTVSPYVSCFHHSIDVFPDNTLQYTATYTWSGQFGSGLSFYLLFLAGMEPYPGCQYRGGPYQAGPNNMHNNYSYTTLNVNWPVHSWHQIGIWWTGMNQQTGCYIDGQSLGFSNFSWDGLSYYYLALWYGNYLQIGNFFAEMPIADGLGNNKVDFFAGGTMKDVMLFNTVLGSFTPPDRYPSATPTNTSYQFNGRFARAGSATTRIPQKELPYNVPVTVTSVAYTDYRPTVNSNGVQINANRPRCYLAWKKSSDGTGTFGTQVLPGNGESRGITAAGGTGPLTLAPDETLDYEVQFDNSSVNPANVTPYFDDVTITFTTSPKFLFWSTNYD